MCKQGRRGRPPEGPEPGDLPRIALLAAQFRGTRRPVTLLRKESIVLCRNSCPLILWFLSIAHLGHVSPPSTPRQHVLAVRQRSSPLAYR